jgi:ElaB/YqjD/DUF883 family membrane-anchored ribosome-binding protein
MVISRKMQFSTFEPSLFTFEPAATDILEQADQTAKQVKSLYNRAVEKTCEGSKAADDILHHHTYKLLATGMLMGLVAGCLVSHRCRCCSR